MKLAELQARFHELVTARESVAAALATRGPDVRRAIEGEVAGDARLSAVDRLEIYADMYFHRIYDVLREELPRTLATMGERAFHTLVTDYLVACPPAHPSLREAGARLPAFLATHPVGAERPWLAELARLERTRLELFDGPDAPPLTVGTLRALPPEQFGALELRLVPCHALLDNRHAIAEVWRGDDPAPTPPAAQSETLLVWRRDVEVLHRPVDAEESGWLRRAASGLRFEVLCEELAAGRSDEEAAAQAFALLGRWAADELCQGRELDAAGELLA